MTAWREDDGFWEAFFRAMFGADTLARTPGDVDGVLALSEPPAGARVLDLCCGPGRHSLELARRGFAVTGVDRTAAYLERARKEADAEGLSIEFLQADAREFRQPGAFGLAINLYTSFGYFEDPEDDRAVVRNLAGSLAPGGKLVMEMVGKEVLARVFQKRIWARDGDLLMLQEAEIREDWGWVRNVWTIVRDGAQVEREVGHRLYSAAELKALLTDAGFASAKAYGSLAGEAYDEAAKRLVVVAEKGSD